MTMFPAFAKILSPAKMARTTISAVLLLIGLVACSGHDMQMGSKEVYTANNISITGSWTNAGKSDGNSAAYLQITNLGDTPDTLLTVSTDVSQFSEIHQSLQEDGVSLMRKMDNLPIAPGATVMLEPGSYHIMLIKLADDITKGTDVPLTLTFEKAGDLKITAPATKAGGGHHHH